MQDTKEQKPFKDSFKNHFASMSSLTVYRSGRQRCAPDFHRRNRIYEFYILHYVTKGTGTYLINGKQYQVGPGDAFLIYPGMPIDKFTNPNDPWEYSWVGFNGTDAQMLMAMTLFSLDNAVIHFDDAKIWEQIEGIYACRGMQSYSILKMTAKLYELLSYIVEKSSKEFAHSKIDDKYVAEASEYIGSHYADKSLSVEDVASYVCISRSRLFRAFKVVMNSSPVKFIEEIRIREACVLLSRTNMNIAEVADKVGYRDPLYFSKVFKSVMNSTPTQYRGNPLSPGQMKSKVFG